ncbi:LLM class flavin-dependent oxidoreductase [Hymenobacter sp. BRD67]|uniref:LLM class flavin-dependent oxidoreductase n=1 Tax=Hymenobacter sp. BRD67 TaxID=2675877 RepID=UPI0020B7C9ED|nr:hypothetical protein [Hymenobacter sp. BRD67]
MPASPSLRLSVLDQSPVRPGATSRQALLETTELARLADRLGYTRFWVSEHHNTTSLAGPAPKCCWRTWERTPGISGWARAASCCPIIRP